MSNIESHQAQRLAVLSEHEQTVSCHPLLQLQPGEVDDDTWVLLWSQSQNALHLETLSDMLQSNRKAYSDDRQMDYVPLMVAGRALVESIANSIRNTIRLRESKKLALTQ